MMMETIKAVVKKPMVSTVKGAISGAMKGGIKKGVDLVGMAKKLAGKAMMKKKMMSGSKPYATKS